MKDSTKKFFRFGLITKGVVYLLIGILFITVSQSPTGKDAILFISQQPFGKILLALITVGLMGYVVWRWYQALEDPDNEGSDSEGMAKRVGYAASGMVYASLAIYALIILLNSGSGNSVQKQDVLQYLLSNSWGPWLVGLAGLFLAGTGIFHFYKVYKEKYKEKIYLSMLSQSEREIYDMSAKAGLSSRGVIFVILGYFLLRAAIKSNPGQEVNTGEVFQFLQNSDFPLAAMLIALGLAAYGVYMFIMARYRPI